MAILSRTEARRFYDRLGAGQDTQHWYEDPATGELAAHGRFGEAGAVFEFGCGTGRFAERLLAGELPATASYDAIDLSATMVGLARERLTPYGGRARVQQVDGDPAIDRPDACCDRFVTAYVLDLLSGDDIRSVLAEAARLLEDGGLLCIASLGEGTGPISRGIAGLWGLIHRLRPGLVGGCRPLRLAPYIDAGPWAIEHRRIIVAWGIPSEVIVARRLPRTTA